MRRSAIISDDQLYRYTLARRWSDDESAFATFVMLNPSTADALVDDPTITRCIGFAKSWDMGALHVLNLYALRSVDPKVLWTAEDPVGPKNDDYLTRHANIALATGWPLVAGWGANAKPDRVEAVLALLGENTLQCLGTTKAGAPRHPLYLKADTPLEPWPSQT